VKRVNNLTERREGKEEKFRKRKEDKAAVTNSQRVGTVTSTKGGKAKNISKQAKKAPEHRPVTEMDFEDDYDEEDDEIGGE